jgi:hypothetical protein
VQCLDAGVVGLQHGGQHVLGDEEVGEEVGPSPQCGVGDVLLVRRAGPSSAQASTCLRVAVWDGDLVELDGSAREGGEVGARAVPDRVDDLVGVSSCGEWPVSGSGWNRAMGIAAA